MPLTGADFNIILNLARYYPYTLLVSVLYSGVTDSNPPSVYACAITIMNYSTQFL